MEITFEKLPEAVQIIDMRLDRIEKLLENHSEPPHPDTLFTAPEIAEYLNLSISTIYGLVSRREIEHQKRGKRLYFLKSDIDNWLAQGRRKTRAEIEAEVIGE